MFEYHSTLIFPKLPFEDGGVEKVLLQLKKNLDVHGGDCSIEKDTLSFAGNPAKFIHLDPLDNISGEIHVTLVGEDLIFSYSISYLGPMIFLGTLIMLHFVSKDEFFRGVSLIASIALLLFFLFGGFIFINLLKFTYDEVRKASSASALQ